MTRSTGSGKRPFTFTSTGLAGHQIRHGPLPCRARRIRTYTGAETSPAPEPPYRPLRSTVSDCANGLMISARRRARSQASSGRVATPCSGIRGCPSPCSPRFGAITSIEHSRDWCRSLLILNCQELAAQQPLRPINW